MSEELEHHILARFKIIKKIGSGAYGHVWKVIDRKDKKMKALKKNFDAFHNSTDAQRTYRQIMFLSQLQHSNIIQLQEVIRADNDKDIYLLFQYMDIDLHTLIRSNILGQQHQKYIFYQMAKSIYYLHSAGLIHRDLKPANILINENCQAKLCDFGLVRSIDDQADQLQFLTQYIATRWYRAPEILLGSLHYHKGIDMWSFGCLLGEIIRGKPLFPGTSTLNQLERVISWTGIPSQSDINSLRLSQSTSKQFIYLLSKVKPIKKKEFLQTASNECIDLINRLLQFNPDKRINIIQMMKHPYLREFYNEKDLDNKCKHKIKLSINDNQRLNLKDYRLLIYQDIWKKNDTQNKTMYRIREKSSRQSQLQTGKTMKKDQKDDKDKRFTQIRRQSEKRQNQIEKRQLRQQSATEHHQTKSKQFRHKKYSDNNTNISEYKKSGIMVSKHLKTMQSQTGQKKEIIISKEPQSKQTKMEWKKKRSVTEPQKSSKNNKFFPDCGKVYKKVGMNVY